MVRVFLSGEELSGGRLTLTGDAARHVGGALRVRPGEEIGAVTPDGIEHVARVVSAGAHQVVAEVVESRPTGSEPSRRVRVAQALLKGDQFERILEYGSEVGVTSFQPLITQRTVARPDARKLEQRFERWRQVCRQGAELGRRGAIPAVLPAASVAEAVDQAGTDGMSAFLLYEGPGLRSLSTAVGEGDCCIVVGPEGGWSDSEVMLARQAGAEPVSLGPRIMRPLPAALTAVVIALDRSHDLELKEDS